MHAFPRVNILGCGISAINLPQAEQAVLQALLEKRKSYVVIGGVHGILVAQKDSKYKDIINRAILCTPDGMPLVWCGWKAGFKDMDRVYGPDLMLRMMEIGTEHGIRHFLYGGKEGVADILKANMEAKFPGVQITGIYCPPFRELNDGERGELQQMVAEQKPDIIWVGIGAPKQERFMERYLPLLDTTMMCGVGAAFDFHAGKLAQAPRWMQRAGLEWFFRLTKEPRRLWRRYLLGNPLFLWLLFCQWTGLRRYRSPDVA